jgi:hypothetical protein
MSTLVEFAHRQKQLVEKMAAEYRASLAADPLLRVEYASGDDCLKRSLAAAQEQDANGYFAHVSASDLRREIDHPGSF